MNLATRDIRHNLGRFALTTVGIGLLLMIVMGMGGIYRGLIRKATLLVEKIGADLWLVQGSTRGPFAEISRVPASLEDRARAVPGVAGARRFVSHTIQREHRGRPLRMVVQGLSWPGDRGEWIPLTAGRPLGQAHFEMIADRSLGLPLGERLRLGKDSYEVVGLTKGMVGTGGDGLCFFSVSDAAAIQFEMPGEGVRLERQSRGARAEGRDIGRMQPLLLERAAGPASGSNSLRRTISKPSSAVAGRQEDSTRPTTLRNRSSASRPRMPPTSTSSDCVWGEPDVSDAGKEMTNRQLPASLADSVSAWANVNWVSKPPAGRSLWSCSWRA